MGNAPCAHGRMHCCVHMSDVTCVCAHMYSVFAWYDGWIYDDCMLTTQVFQMFDTKQNSVIEFGEFVRSLSVFHPEAPLQQKADCTCVCV